MSASACRQAQWHYPPASASPEATIFSKNEVFKGDTGKKLLLPFQDIAKLFYYYSYLESLNINFAPYPFNAKLIAPLYYIGYESYLGRIRPL